MRTTRWWWSPAVIAVLALLLAARSTAVGTGVAPASEPQTTQQAKMGDVDCGGTVNSVDALHVLRSVAGLPTSAQCLNVAGDVDCDGDQDAVDALRILRYIAGLPADTPGCTPIGRALVTTDDLIEKAVIDGKLTEAEATLYRVFAAFGDSRLPDEYRGAPSDLPDSDAALMASLAYEGLSAEVRATLDPFLTPPYLPGSWLELQTAGQSGAALSGLDDWTRFDAAGGRMKVWARTAFPEEVTKAEAVASALTSTIWPAVTNLMGLEHRPLSDGGLPRGGVDGALDVYLVPLAVHGLTVPTVQERDCEMFPAFIQIDASRALGSQTQPGLLQTVTHELFHAVQFTYDLNTNCWYPEYRWFVEGSATWATDYVYPHAQAEHEYAEAFLEAPWRTLDDAQKYLPKHMYGSYLFPFYLTTKYHQPQLMPAIWEAFATADSLPALDAVLQPLGGLTERFREFILYNWNRPPVDYYNTWDGLTAGSPPAGGRAENVELGNESSKTYDLPTDLLHLTSSYHLFYFMDDSVRSVTFHNTLAGLDHASVQALTKVRGEWQEPEDWSAKRTMILCRDIEQQKVEDLLIVISNNDWQMKQELKPDTPPSITASDMGCSDWTGTITNYWRLTGPGTDVSHTMTVPDVRFSFDPERSTQDRMVYRTVSGTLEATLSSGPGNACVEYGHGLVTLGEGDGELIFSTPSTPGAKRTYWGFGHDLDGSYSYDWSCPDGSHGTDTQHIDIWFLTGEETMGDDPSVLQGEMVYMSEGWIHRCTWYLHATPPEP